MPKTKHTPEHTTQMQNPSLGNINPAGNTLHEAQPKAPATCLASGDPTKHTSNQNRMDTIQSIPTNYYMTTEQQN